MGKNKYNRPVLGAEQLSLSKAYDATTYTNGGTITEDSSGYLTFTVPGDAATADLDLTVSAIWRATDVDGKLATIAAGGFLRSASCFMFEEGTPDTSGDSWIGIALVDDPDLSAAIGKVWAFGYSGVAKQAIAGRNDSGAVTITTGGDIVADRFYGNAWPLGDRYLWRTDTIPFVDEWETTATATANAAGTSLDGDLYWVVFAGRTAATAGTVTLKCRPFVLPTTGVVGPA